VKTAGTASARMPSISTFTDFTSCRIFLRMVSTSIALQAAAAIRTDSMGPTASLFPEN